MKKLLSILGSVGMIGTAGATVVACGKKPAAKEAPKETPEQAKGKLGNDIFEAQGLVNTGTKEESAKVDLDNAITEAQKVFDKKEATVTELQTASENLRKAIEKYNNSKEATVVLKETIDEANVLVTKADKEASAVTTLETAAKAAQKVLDETKTDTARINEATKQLKAAIEIYKNAENKQDPKEAAKTKLKSLIEQAKGLVNTSKKETSVTEMLQTAIDKAQGVLDKQGVSEVELTNGTVSLQEAIDEFKQAEDANLIAARKALQAKITEAQQLADTSKKEEEVTNALRTAIKEAQSVLATQATEQDYKQATTKLNKAIDAFKKAEDASLIAARKALQEKITEAEALVNKAEKVAPPITNLKSAIEVAKKILATKESTEQQLKEATAKLKTAIDTYNEAMAKEKLQEKITEANGLLKLGWKTPEAIKTLTSEVKKAQAILDKKDGKAGDLITALNKLQKAIEIYNQSPNSATGDLLLKLKNHIDAAKALGVIKGPKKTKEQLDAFNKIIEKAQKVLATSKKDSEIKTMTDELLKAIKEFSDFNK